MIDLNKHRMIYIENVEWNHIKARPQYIAEKLSEDFDVTVYSPYSYKLGKSNFTVDGNCEVQFVKKLPFEGRSAVISKINHWYKKKFFKKKITNEIQTVFVTYPEAYDYIPTNYKGVVIYDCMDNMLEFDMSDERKKKVRDLEKALYERADIVFVSSENLKNRLFERYFPKRNCWLIRNGYDGKIATVTNESDVAHEKFKVCYFGTISSWFDFDVIQKSLNEIPELEYEFIGPIEKTITPLQHKRIKYIPPLPHSELQQATKDADAYILPFKVNNLIEAVDPVKFYEYINFSKNIISVYYDEIARFTDFVWFYKDTNQYIEILKNLMQDNGRKYTQQMRLKFLEENTWDKRAQAMCEVIERIIKSKSKT